MINYVLIYLVVCIMCYTHNKDTIISDVKRTSSHNVVKSLRLVGILIASLVITIPVVLIYAWSPLVLLGIFLMALSNKVVRNWKVVDYEYKKEEDAA